MPATVSDIEAVYRARYSAFHATIATITGSAEAARDVVQDAFAEALRERAMFRGDGPLEGWIWQRCLVPTTLQIGRLCTPLNEGWTPWR
jgi:DNA-directed RNA polymerase specialized sigma24 family protein